MIKPTVEDFQEEINTLFLLQIGATVISWLTLGISLTVLYDAYLKFLKKDGLYTEEEVEHIITITRTISLIVAFVFLYNVEEGIKIAKQVGSYNLNLKVQLIAAYITLIPAFLTFLVAISSENELIQSFTPTQELEEEFNPQV